MKVYVVTEERQHMLLLQELLKPYANDEVDFTWAGNWSSADSMARSLLIVKRQPVALVVGVEDDLEEDIRFLKSSLGQVSGDVLYHVCVIAPEIESLLFTDETVVEALIGRPLEPEERALAVRKPCQVLRDAVTPPFEEGDSDWFRSDWLEEKFAERLAGIDLSRVREHPKIVALRRFVEESLRPAAVLAAA